MTSRNENRAGGLSNSRNHFYYLFPCNESGSVSYLSASYSTTSTAYSYSCFSNRSTAATLCITR